MPRILPACTALAAAALLASGPTTVQTAHAAPARCTTYYAPGTRVGPYTSQQVMVADHTSGTRGTWARYEWRGYDHGCWVRVGGSSHALFGRGGVVDGATRRQNTNTTPAGTYPIEYAFGVGNPGTRMPYRRITSRSNWVEDVRRNYNRWVESSAWNHSGEHLADYAGSLYRQAAVIGFNYDRPVFGRGAGIFLHYARYYTGGCVGLDNRTELNDTIRWMRPGAHPTIVILR